FRPFITQVVTGYKMTIWNRWGEKIFESEIPKQGWDGAYKGQQQAAGTYVYQIQFIDFDGVPVNVKGTLNLVQ
ncbi:MAG: gliding motility-associated C-terminal domain-containing protein, partial [Sphingobacteriales bacterium]|nr:gliding motility-associated C-terminal domain-containing protein [Sphingobacteriales bacterium]